MSSPNGTLRATALEDHGDLSVRAMQLAAELDEALALGRLDALAPEVVLLDIGLPGLDGYQVAERLRREPGLEATTIIAITGYGEDHARRRSREAGFDHHLVKPVDPDLLTRLLDRPAADRSPA